MPAARRSRFQRRTSAKVRSSHVGHGFSNLGGGGGRDWAGRLSERRQSRAPRSPPSLARALLPSLAPLPASPPAVPQRLGRAVVRGQPAARGAGSLWGSPAGGCSGRLQRGAAKRRLHNKLRAPVLEGVRVCHPRARTCAEAACGGGAGAGGARLDPVCAHRAPAKSTARWAAGRRVKSGAQGGGRRASDQLALCPPYRTATRSHSPAGSRCRWSRGRRVVAWAQALRQLVSIQGRGACDTQYERGCQALAGLIRSLCLLTARLLRSTRGAAFPRSRALRCRKAEPLCDSKCVQGAQSGGGPKLASAS